MSQKNLFNIFLIFLLINSISSSILVKAGKKINFSCEKDILYISIDVIFSEKPEKRILILLNYKAIIKLLIHKQN